ncbi:hypothetical protein BC829DRAFT_413535 [Chytridium lagenaria]|nr:hypothetical protein BC829DRAFT_413535 [Chytridium lagenaria]
MNGEEAIDVTVTTNFIEDLANRRVNDKHAILDYWFRPKALEDENLVSLVENYHMARGAGRLDQALLSDHPFAGRYHFVANKSRAIMVLTGMHDKLPDIAGTQQGDKARELHYKLLCILFKPHRKGTLGAESWEDLFSNWVETNKSSAHVIDALSFADIHDDYHQSVRHDKAAPHRQTEEDICLHNHPCEAHHESQTITSAYHSELPQDEDMDAENGVESGVFCTLSIPKRILDVKLYQNELVFRDEHIGVNMGTTYYRLYCETLVEQLVECSGPVPFVDPYTRPAHERDRSKLPVYPSIQAVAIAFTLNFWQHCAFEEAARKLIFSFLNDTAADSGTRRSTKHSRTLPQLKDCRIHSNWYRMLAGKLALESPRLEKWLSYHMKEARDMVMGGKHVMMFGDLMQLLPINTPFFRELTDTSTALQRQGFEVFSRINFTVFLTQNMRQREDPLFTRIIRGIRYGCITDEDLDILNRRCVDHPDFEPPPVPEDFAKDGYYCPVVCALNKDRAVIGQSLALVMAPRCEPIFICRAEKAKKSTSTVNMETLYGHSDYMTDFIPFTLTFYIGMPVMFTRKVIKEPDSKHDKSPTTTLIPKGTIAIIVGVQLHPDDRGKGALPSSDGKYNFQYLTRLPDFIFVKIRGSDDVLFQGGYPAGVIPVRPLHVAAKISMPGCDSFSITVDQFPVIPFFSCTPEKLQGTTLPHGVIILNLRTGTLYVALSRTTSLKSLVLLKRITREDIKYFTPTEAVMAAMLNLMGKVRRPDYATDEQWRDYYTWMVENTVTSTSPMGIV